MSKIPGIAIVVTKQNPANDKIMSQISFGRNLGAYKPYTAFVVSNPMMRADGGSEQDAIFRLKRHLFSHLFGRVISCQTLNLNEFIVEEILTQ